MPPVKTKFFLCNLKQCPQPSLPKNNGNPSLYNGALNNPGNLVTQAILYANGAKYVSAAPSYWVTKIYPVTGRVIAPLANNLYN